MVTTAAIELKKSVFQLFSIVLFFFFRECADFSPDFHLKS